MSLAASAGRGPGALWSPTHVQVTVLQARGLRAKGPGGTSDAYAVIQVGKEKYATSVSERSLGAPVWREEATFELPPLLSAGAAPQAAATLQLTVLHRALLGLDKFLGRAEVDLRELHWDQGRRKTQCPQLVFTETFHHQGYRLAHDCQKRKNTNNPLDIYRYANDSRPGLGDYIVKTSIWWYTLKSKPGKKNKERGEIEVDIQFMRNNMTASMFDLSMKDKSRNPFGKLKDKIKGKNKDSASDSASAIVPSMTPSGDSDDESSTKDKKKKSKIKTLFSKSNLQKTPLSQSMSVLPTSKSDKVLLRPGDFQSRWEDDDNEGESSSASDIMTHKRTASADPKQLNQINFNLSKKEGLSFLSGFRSKNDTLSRSNVCINGNHVYLEQPESKSETKDSTPSSSPSPQGFRKKHLFSSTENLAPRSWKEPGEAGEVASDRLLSESFTKDSLKSMSLPSYRPLVSGDVRGNTAPVSLEAGKETKESKKQENKKHSLLSLVMGKKDMAKGSEEESPPTIPEKEKGGVLPEIQPRKHESEPVKDLMKKSEKDTSSVVYEWNKSLNPFEEVQITEPEAEPESKPEPKLPVPSPRAPQTKAVKPRLEVSPEAQPKARLPSSPDLPVFVHARSPGSSQTLLPSELGHDSETQSSESPPVSSSFSSPVVAPISTSTPIDSWPHTDKDQTISEEPSLHLKAEFQKESIAQVPNTVSSALGSLSKELPIAVCKETEDSLTMETGDVDTEKNTSDEKVENSLLEQPEVGQQEEELLRFPYKKQDYIPSSEEAQEKTFALSVRSGRIESSARKPWMRENADFEIQSRSLVENKVRNGEMTSAIKEVVPPLKMGEAVPPLDSVTQTHEEMGLNASEGQKKVKKRVSFSEHLFTEEEVEKSTGWIEEDRNNPQEMTQERAAAGSVCDREPSTSPHTEDSERESVAESRLLNCDVPVSMVDQEESFSEKPTNETSSEKDIPLIRTKGDDTLMEQYQSKASDHEGLLADPLNDLQSATDAKSPVMADLNLTLSSIPEVTSDDEKVDQVEDVEETAKVAALEVGASSLSMSPPYPEKKKGLRGMGDDPTVPAENLCALGSKAPKASVIASSDQIAALGIHKPHLGKSSSLDKQLPNPGSGDEEKLEENGRPSQPPGTSLESPVSSPSLSEPFSATHSCPSFPHSNTHHSSTAESQKKATAEGSAAKVDSSGKRKPLLQAWVSPSETHPVSAQPGTGSWSAKHRLHPVKPMNTTATKITSSSLGTATIISENMVNEAIMKKYKPSDPAFAYAQLTHDELIQLVLRQKETISKKEFQVRELEDYIDNLLVRVMEETPNILRIPAQVGKKAGKI